MKTTSEEVLAERLIAAEVQLQREFASVSEPDERAEAQLRREKYLEIIRAWLDGD